MSKTLTTSMAQVDGFAVLKGPDAFRTISEAADELGVPQHVLRFWETKFSFIRPMKRAGGRRFYRRQDLDLLRGVRALLHEEGYTIKGVQRLHKEQGVRRLMIAAGGEVDAAVLAELEEAEAQRTVDLHETDVPAAEAVGVAGMAPQTRARLEAVLEELNTAKMRLDVLLDQSAAGDS